MEPRKNEANELTRESMQDTGALYDVFWSV